MKITWKTKVGETLVDETLYAVRPHPTLADVYEIWTGDESVGSMTVRGRDDVSLSVFRVDHAPRLNIVRDEFSAFWRLGLAVREATIRFNTAIARVLLSPRSPLARVELLQEFAAYAETWLARVAKALDRRSRLRPADVRDHGRRHRRGAP